MGDGEIEDWVGVVQFERHAPFILSNSIIISDEFLKGLT